MPFLRQIDDELHPSTAASVGAIDLIRFASDPGESRLGWTDRLVGAGSFLFRQPYRLSARQYRWNLLRRFAAESVRLSANGGHSTSAGCHSD
jgi:hypothetical protein